MRRSHVTLLEVILVVSVIIVLAALVVPVTSMAREKNRRVNCAGNLKSTGLALLMYSGDYDGYFPGAHPNGSPSFEPLTKKNYIQDGKVWACPSRSMVLTLASNSAYVYIGSGLMDDNKNAKSVSLAYDQYGNHPRNGWMNVLFIDGHAAGAKPGSTPWAHNAP